MITAVEVYFPSGKTQTIIVGKDGVKNAFFDRENGHLIVLTEDNIVEYTLPCVAMKEYKEKDSK